MWRRGGRRSEGCLGGGAARDDECLAFRAAISVVGDTVIILVRSACYVE